MDDKCKDCEDQERCEGKAAKKVMYIADRLADMLGDSGLEPSPELIVGLLGMTCIVAKELKMPMHVLAEGMRLAIAMLGDPPPKGVAAYIMARGCNEQVH